MPGFDEQPGYAEAGIREGMETMKHEVEQEQ
jgi:hypothetical protein